MHYRPESGEYGPLFVYYHGGGWGFGFPETNEAVFEILTKELGFTVVGVAYWLAPEHAFPTAANDAYDSLKWVCTLMIAIQRSSNANIRLLKTRRNSGRIRQRESSFRELRRVGILRLSRLTKLWTKSYLLRSRVCF